MASATNLMREVDACCGKRGPYCEACQARNAALKAHVGAVRGAITDSFPARLVPAPVVEPVAVGDVWEGVLEFRTVRVVSVNEAEVVSRDMNSRGWFEHFGLAEFRERFTRSVLGLDFEQVTRGEED